MTSIPYLHRALSLQPLATNERRLLCNGQCHVVRFVIGVATRSKNSSILIANGVSESEESLECMIRECNETFPQWNPLPKLHTILAKVSKSKTGFNGICFNKIHLIPAERQFASLVEAAKCGEVALGEHYYKVHRVVRQAYDLYAQDLKALENGVPRATEAIVVDPDDTKAQQLLDQVIRLTNYIEEISEKKDKAVADNLDDLRKGNDRQHDVATGFNQNLGKVLDKLPSPGHGSCIVQRDVGTNTSPKTSPSKEMTIKLQGETANLQRKIASLESQMQAKVKELKEEKENHKITEAGRQQQGREKLDAQYDLFNANIENTGLQKSNDSLLSTVMQLEDENQELALLLKIYKQQLFYMEFLASLLEQPSRADFTKVLMQFLDFVAMVKEHFPHVNAGSGIFRPLAQAARARLGDSDDEGEDNGDVRGGYESSGSSIGGYTTPVLDDDDTIEA